MKKMMFLACLVFGITAMTAVAADVQAISDTKDNDMIAQLTTMDGPAWVEYLTAVIESGKDKLIKRVLSNAQDALNDMDDETARTIATAINDGVPAVSISRRLNGKYKLSYVPSKMADDVTIKLKIQQITKGLGDISSGANKD